MENDLKLLVQTRQNILKSIENLTLNQLNTVPNGYTNSIFWNAAHVVVTQQLLIYFLSENEMYCSKDLINKYKKGTKFESKATKEEILEVKELLVETPTLLKNDYKKGKFKNYKEYPTSYGFTLNSIEDAIKFNNVHEALYFGYIMAMKKNLM